MQSTSAFVSSRGSYHCTPVCNAISSSAKRSNAAAAPAYANSVSVTKAADRQQQSNNTVTSSIRGDDKVLRPSKILEDSTRGPSVCVPASETHANQERLLTLQLLNQHTQGLAAQGYSIYAAATAPAGVDVQVWQQGMVKLVAGCTGSSMKEAQQQVQAILANPRATPCFVAYGPDSLHPGHKTICGVAVGTVEEGSFGVNKPCSPGQVATMSAAESFAHLAPTQQNKKLKIDAVWISGDIAAAPILNDDGLAEPCQSCESVNCRTCRSGSIGRTLLLWLMGEAGCFDSTDAEVSMAAWNFNHAATGLYSQLGFEPWHEPRGPPGATPACCSNACNTVKPPSNLATPAAHPFGYDASVDSSSTDVAGLVKPHSSALWTAVTTASCAGVCSGRRLTSGALESVGINRNRCYGLVSKVTAVKLAKPQLKLISARQLSVAANAHRVSDLSESGVVDRKRELCATNCSLSADVSSNKQQVKMTGASMSRTVNMYRKAGLLIKLCDSSGPDLSSVVHTGAAVV